MKTPKKLRHEAGQRLDSTRLLSLVVGSQINVNDEFMATVEEVQGDMIRLSSSQFNGWAHRDELQTIPA